MSHTVPMSEKERLREALLAFDAMRDEKSRKLYLRELEEQLGHALNPTSYGDARHDLWDLIHECLNHPGALSTLATILKSFHGPSQAVATLEPIVTAIERRTPVTASERETLLEIVSNVPSHWVSVVFETLPGLPHPSDADWSDMRSVLAYLEEHTATDAEPSSVLQFVDALAHICPEDKSRTLHHWINDVAARLRFDEPALHRLCSHSIQTGGNRSHHPLHDTPSEHDDHMSQDVARPPGENVRIVPAAVAQTAADPSEPRPRVWGGVPLRNPNFTGRHSLLQQLRDQLKRHSQASVLPQALHGLGGVGKTQLVIEYAYRYVDHYDIIWWISAERQTEVLASLADLGGRLMVSGAQDNKQQYARAVLDALSTTLYRWLLVYDNAEHSDELTLLIPSAGGHVIVTSRSPDWPAKWRPIEVDVFRRTESIELLQKQDQGLSIDDANRLANKLGDLPLALEQASNFQRAAGMTAEEYLQEFDHRVRELLSEGKPSDYPTTVAAYLSIAFDSLRENAPTAAELLELFAFLGPEPVSATLLRNGKNAELSENLRRTLGNSLEMGRIIRELRRYGLAKVESRGQKLQVHRLVQSVLRMDLNEDRKTRRRNDVRSILAAANPSHPDDRDNWPVHAQLGPHIIPADLVSADNYDAKLVALDQSRYLFLNGDYSGSRTLGELMYQTWSKPASQGGLGRSHELTLLAMRHLANALRMTGEYDGARRLDKEALDALIADPAFGNDHEHTVGVAFGLGFDLSIAGDLPGALRSDRENAERAARVYGETHEYTLQARRNLAASLRQLGRFREAHELSQTIVEAQRREGGDSDPRTLWSISELARDLHGLGRYQEALEIQLPAWERARQVLDPHHRDVLLAERNIAIATRKTGDCRRAMIHARENYLAFHTQFGPSHEYTLASGMTYANTLRTTGRLQEARSAAHDTVEGYREKFGPNHRFTLVAQVNQGIILRVLGEQDDAHNLEHDTYHALRNLLGEEHPYTLCAANGYANSLVQNHQLDEAREFAKKTLELSIRTRGSEHPDTIACAINTFFNLRQSNRSEATRLLLESIERLENLLGHNHPDAADARKGKRPDCDIEPPPT